MLDYSVEPKAGPLKCISLRHNRFVSISQHETIWKILPGSRHAFRGPALSNAFPEKV